MDFNGSTQYINLGTAAIPDNTDFTITSWVNMDDISGVDVGVDVELLGVWEAETTSPAHSTTPAGTDRLLILFISNEIAVSGAVTSVTYGGETMTQVDDVTIVDSFDGRIDMFILNEDGIAASSGQSFVVVYPTIAEVAYHHVFLENVDQDTPTGTVQKTAIDHALAGNPNTTTTTAITTAAGSMVVACIHTSPVDTHVSNILTEGTDITNLDLSTFSASSTQYLLSTGAAITPSFSTTLALDRQAMMGVEINVALGGSYSIFHAGDNLTPYDGARLQIKRGSNGGRIGSYNPDAAADNFSAAIAITANQWDLAAIRGTQAAGGSSVGILGSPAWVAGTSHTVEAGTDRLLVFCASNRTTTSSVILNTVTYGTESLVKVGDVTVDATVDGRVEMWRLLEVGVAAAASSTIVPTWSSTPGDHDPVYASAFFENVHQTTPTGNTSSNTKILAVGGGSVTIVGSWVAGDSGSSHAVESGPNRLFVVISAAEHSFSAEDLTMDGVTYGGESMTLIGGTKVDDSGADGYVHIWYLNETGIVAASGSTIVTDWSDTGTPPLPEEEILMSVFLINVNQSIPTGNTASNNGVATTTTLATSSSIASQSGDMIIAGGFSGNPTADFVANNSFTLGIDSVGFIGTPSAAGCAIHKDSTGSAETPSISSAGANRMVIFGVEVNAHPSAGVNLIGSYTVNTGTSYSHIAPAGNNRILIFHATHNNGGSLDSLMNPPTPTYGTQSMTFIGTQTVGTTNLNRIYLWYLDEAGIEAASTTTVAYSWNATPDSTPTRPRYITAFFENVDQVALVDGYVDAIDATADVTLATAAITTTNGDMIIACASCGQTTTYTPNNGFAEGFDFNDGTSHAVTGIYQNGTGSSLTPSVTKAITGNRMVITACRLNVASTDGTIATSSSIANNNNEMVVAAAMTELTTGSFSPNNSFTEGIESTGSSSRIVTLYKSTTGSAETPSTTHTDPNIMAIFGAELNVSAGGGSGTIDVSVNGGAWTNLISGDTSGWAIGTTNIQSIGSEFKDNASDLFTDGSIADTRCYDRQLDDAEIASIYIAKGKDNIIDGLLARWPCRNGTIGTTPAAPSVSFVDSHTVTTTTGNTVILDVGTDLTTQFRDFIIIAVGDGNVTGGGTATTVFATSVWELLNEGQTALPSTASTPSLSLFCKFALASETSYTFTSSTGGTHNMVAVACSYRNCPINTGATSTINTGNSVTATSPALAMTATSLVLSIAAKDDGTTGTFSATGSQTLRAQAGVSNTDPNGVRVVIGDVIGATSSGAQTWGLTTDQWGALTVNVFSNRVVDHSGSTGHPHDIAAVGNPVYIETDLRI